MPWCNDCSRFWTMDAVATDGICPTCGAPLPEPGTGEGVGTPWHFKLLVLAVIAYLGWRAIELVVWLISRF